MKRAIACQFQLRLVILRAWFETAPESRTRGGSEDVDTAAGIAARAGDTAGAGSIGITAFGPHIVHSGSDSIANITIVQIA